jgi:hypothetical protein
MKLYLLPGLDISLTIHVICWSYQYPTVLCAVLYDMTHVCPNDIRSKYCLILTL